MTTPPRGPEEAERWLCAGLCLARLEGTSPEAVAQAVPWLLAAHAELPALPPLGVVVDLGRLALGAPLESSRPVPDTEPSLRAAVRAYEDHLLARLAAEPHLEAVVNALARMPVELRPRGVAFLVARVLTRLGFTGGTAVNPGLARRVLEHPPAELLQTGHAALRERGVEVERLAGAYEALGGAARRARALLGDAEVFTLENLERLHGRARRLALEQAVEAAEALAEALPTRARPRKPVSGQTPSHLEDDAAFPQGGFSSVSNVGSLENLVTSELVYMEDDAGLDLFDMRYVEGELLYYTRDESLVVRRRRRVTFVLLPGLTEARVKDAGLRWQRGVLVLGLVLSLVRRLSVWLGEEELRFRVVVVGEGLEAERGLCELLLREWLARGTAEVTVAERLESVLSQAAEDAKRARTDVLLLGGREVPPASSQVGLSLLDVSQPVPRLLPASSPESPGEEIWATWRGVALELARGLL
ncbi:hypothetical protein [Cystobacter fuscus]|uniref:hypothetical protein n=1 Tax=Cystobacter fuscus TaxID=43 RepID=UPI002B306CB1|nr:hypothetical protein F0U63_12545 [Cystobacter fuscus]